MVKTLYIGNLSFNSSEEDLRNFFSDYETVSSVKIITDRETGRSRGFGFVELDENEANGAIEALDGGELDGRNLRINEAKKREPRRDRF